MEKLILNDVGDGLNMKILDDEKNLIVDFGGTKNLELCYNCSCSSFLLSHFHADHYNGFFEPYFPFPIKLDNFYYPMMPYFSEKEEFYLALISMNIRIAPIQLQILSHIKKLNNNRPICFKALSKGDIISCGKNRIEILWPPKTLEEKETIKGIKEAINDFNKAKEKDPMLAEIYKQVERLYPNRENDSFFTLLISYDMADQTKSNFNSKIMPPEIETANKSLRNAANSLSIVFRQEDNVLFLGDIENEFETIVSDLRDKKAMNYDIIIAAHHGTHWHKSLNEMSCDICLASAGNNMRKHIKYEYRDIANKFIRTDEWGDIRVDNKKNLW